MGCINTILKNHIILKSTYSFVYVRERSISNLAAMLLCVILNNLIGIHGCSLISLYSHCHFSKLSFIFCISNKNIFPSVMWLVFLFQDYCLSSRGEKKKTLNSSLKKSNKMIHKT